MKEKNIENLIIKFISKTINHEELDELSAWVEKDGNVEVFKHYINVNYALDFNLLTFDDDRAAEKLMQKIDGSDTGGKAIKAFFGRTFRVAAAIAVIVASSIFLYVEKKDNDGDAIVVVEKSTVVPGSDKAVLTLENGDYVTLEKGKHYSSQNRNSDGERLLYDQEEISGSRVQYNFLTIPRGGQFFVRLSDGTQVWLNADSKLKYPVTFAKGQTREVELLYGEAYFDVSPSAEHDGAAFRVKNQMQTIEVLGTEFNVKSYREDALSYTTLVEGSVAIGNDIVSKILRPGEQSVIGQKSEEINIKKVDVNYEVAWKKGLFMFNNEPLEAMLKTLSRWYNVDVVFENEGKRLERYSGVLHRTDNIENLLLLLEKTGEVNFEIKDNEITIK